MSDPPDPLTVTECDLRGMEWMPLFGARLFMSDFEARASDEEFRAAVRLWWMAWQQVPAASLPNDDAVLCRLAGLGRNTKVWTKIRDTVMHGFVLCSDGRYYHKVLSIHANDAWDKRVKGREKKQRWREKGGGGTGTERYANGSGTGTEPEPSRSRTTAEPGQDGSGTADKDKDKDKDKEREKEEREVAPEHASVSPKPAPGKPDAHPPPKRSKIRQDWFPVSDDAVMFAEDLLGAEAFENVLQKFVDHHLAKGSTMEDWDAAWRGWCRKEIEFRQQNQSTRH
jgi:hypothetical protein